MGNYRIRKKTIDIHGRIKEINSNRTKCTHANGFLRVLCVNALFSNIDRFRLSRYNIIYNTGIYPDIYRVKEFKNKSLATSQWPRMTDQRITCSRFTSVNISTSETNKYWTNIGPTRPGNGNRVTNSVRIGSIRRRTGKTKKFGWTRMTTGKLNCFGFFPPPSPTNTRLVISNNVLKRPLTLKRQTHT